MIDKQTQDQAWRCAPKAFREAVKEMYQATQLTGVQLAVDVERAGRYAEALEAVFGEHNLTSGAEPEEVLMVPRKKVLNMYDFNDDILICDPTHNGAKLLKVKLQELFGSKCLPDEPEHGLEQTSVKVEEKKGGPTQTNDNMEEKELNLKEIVDSDFYCDYKECYRNGEGNLPPLKCDKVLCVARGMKLKRWKPAKGEKYWYLNEFMNVSTSFYDDEDLDAYTKVEKTNNCFQSFDLAQQAAEAVKAALEQFHKDHPQ